MRKVLSSIVLLALLSANNLTFVYANEWDSLQKNVQTNEKILDTIENKLTDALDAVNAKVQDPERSRRIEEKQQEIQELIQQTKEDIKDDTSKAEMAKKMEDVKNTVVLKAVSGVTPYTDATESISSQVDIPKKDLAKAEDTLINSMESGEWYSLMIKTKLSQEGVLKLLRKYDENLKLNFQFDEDSFSVYELTVSKNSLLKQELLENIEEGEIPNHIVGIQVIKPELLKIGEDASLAWEDQDKLWGLRKYGLSNYESELKNQSLKLGRKIRVGIIDTGIDYRHPDLKDVVNKGLWYDFVNDDTDPLDDQGHGTHVSGTIAGEINHSWVFWVNPNVELVGLKICDNKGFCPSYAVLKALKYANEHKFDILNMSLGGKGNPVSNPICDAIKSASENGSIVVAAAGNSNVNTSTFVPGGCSDAITVWAVDEGLTRASFSNYGDKVDVSAPGVNIYSTYPGGAYKSLNGTSMATPHIVGLASIVRAYKPEVRADEMKVLFKNNTLPVITEGSKKIAGFVNFDGLMASLWVHTENNQLKQETVKEPLNISPPQTETIHSNPSSIASSEPKESTGSAEKPTEPEVGTLDEGLRIQLIDETEQTRINSAEDTSLSSGDTEQKSETLNLNGDAKDEHSGTGDLTQTGNVSETGIKEMSEEGEAGTAESENASIQNAYTCSFTVWGSCYLDLYRANMYSYTASVAGMLSYSTTTSRVTVYGSRAGTATFYIKNGARIVHTIVVTVSNPVRNLTASIGATSIQNGNSTYVTIADGNGWYGVASSNTNVAQVSGSNTSWTVYGKSIGSATITVRDAKGKIVTFALSVTARNLLINAANLTIDPGTYGYFNITDGNGGYALTRNNSNISIYTNGINAYKVYGNTAGSSIIQIRDSQGRIVNVTVSILSPLSVTGFNQSRTAIQWETIGFTVTSGNGGYTVSSSNPSVAYTSMVGGIWSIYAVNPGTTTITVRDLQGKTVSLTLTVNPKITPKITAGFASVSFDQIGVGFWQARITVSWSYGEIGFENYQKLSKESDNVYLVNIYNPNCTSNCDFNGKLYLKDANGNTVYYQNNRILAYNYDTSSIWIASAEGDDSEKWSDGSIDRNVVEDTDIWKDASSDEKNGTQTGSESWVEINSVASDAAKWVVTQVSGATNYAGTTIKKADITRHLRNWSNLSERDRNDFQDGLMDTLTTNGLYDTATNFLAGIAIDRTATVIWKALVSKFGKKVAVKLWAKLVPYLWWAMLGFSLQQAGAENGTYMAYCSSNLTNRYDGLGPLYYCGKLVVNGMFVAAGVGVSRVYEKYAFRNAVIRNLNYEKVAYQMNARAWTVRDIENVIKNPYKKWRSVDNFSRTWDPATAYFVSNNQYIVVNDKTGLIVQISNKNESNWNVDSRIYYIK